ncbi:MULTISPECIES: 2-oxo-tetronate isomerase [Atlantibacter]|uniref:2-oxo-tetronate isomerase n=1 Tax=Atlantibacter TaxID=1903434 RepID=UPI0016058060|nr:MULTISPECIES: 2-oxo-tetronate isomerase [Atlantibacter]MBB3323509.1 PncC family amidohydrolase [Atlantibacter sp. RC6]MBL7636450.1 2-oxo-tetronate isomerase [Atlantibacter hermannii]MBL7675809.1 2-oxo-tetronate isomerase [Atlantibacter hermannii]MCZ7833839.1 2-oxo-tetronate isomerase [Atlantibacter hermannii]
MDQEQLIQQADELGKLFIAKKLRLTTAESCTGGQLAVALCAAENTPDFYSCGFITFNDEAKSTLVNVRPETLARYTAVSQQTVEEMVAGALARSGEDIGVAISGYAGPDGGPDGTPAGTVWFAWGHADNIKTAVKRFEGDSVEVLQQAVVYALSMLKEYVTHSAN